MLPNFSQPFEIVFLDTEHCYNKELEMQRIEKDLDPARSLVADNTAVAILQLEDRLENA